MLESIEQHSSMQLMESDMIEKIIGNIQQALDGKKIVRLAHTLDEGLDLTVLPDIPQEIWYKYPTVGEDIIKPALEELGIKCVRPFPSSHRDRMYHYDHLIWKMRSDGYIDEMEEEPIFFAYKNSVHLDEVAEEYGYRLMMPSHNLFKELQYKGSLEKYGVTPEVGLVPFVEMTVTELDYGSIVEQFGTKFVVQFSFSDAGWNTFGSQDTHIISSAEDLQVVKDQYTGESLAKVSKFIDGMPVATIAVNTSRGTLVNAPYLQITGEPHIVQDDKNARLLFCGGNYRHGEHISDNAWQQIKSISQTVGQEIYKKQYKGIFGLDLMIERESDRVYVLEINPRFSGTTMSTNFLCQRNGILPLIGLHLAEHLGCIPESFTLDDYQQQIEDQRDYAYFFIRPREGRTVQIDTAPRVGVYRITDSGIEFIKESYKLADVPDTNHFLLTRMWPRKRNIEPSKMQLCEIWTLEDAFNGVELNEKYRNVSDCIYAEFEFVPENTYDSSVPYQVL